MGIGYGRCHTGGTKAIVRYWGGDRLKVEMS